MRKHDRYDTGIPVKFYQSDISQQFTLPLVNISHGGLSCCFPRPVTIGSEITINVDLVTPPAELLGKITWCRKFSEHYEVGLQFLDENDPFLMRMVKQVCHIENYKEDQNSNRGREISSEEAAREWIEKFAVDFPK